MVNAPLSRAPKGLWVILHQEVRRVLNTAEVESNQLQNLKVSRSGQLHLEEELTIKLSGQVNDTQKFRAVSLKNIIFITNHFWKNVVSPKISEHVISLSSQRTDSVRSHQTANEYFEKQNRTTEWFEPKSQYGKENFCMLTYPVCWRFWRSSSYI